MTQVAYVGVDLRWVPIAWLQPNLRLAGGAAFVDAALTEGDTRFHDSATGLFDDMTSPYASIGLGLLLRSTTRAFENEKGELASLSFGVLFEGGYTLAKAVNIVLDGPGPNALDISLSEAALGELERSGPYVRVSLVGRI